MLHLTSQSQIFLAKDPVDFRKQIDGLCSLCSQHFQQQPNNGSLYVFTNRARTMIKILHYDHNGYWLALKRLSRGKFSGWPTLAGKSLHLKAHELQQILRNTLASARELR